MNRFLCEPDNLKLNSTTAFHFSQILANISIHTLPILALAGNLLIIIVILTNSQLNRSSFSVYIKTMAVSDTLVLVLKLISFENKTSQKFYSSSMCTILVFLSEASVLLSVWTIVLITIERTLVVLFPIHIKKFVSVYHARILITGIAIISFLFSTRVLFIPIDISSVQKCQPMPDWQNYRQLNITITEFTYCYIPLSIVIIGNFITLCAVKRAASQRRQILTNNTYNNKCQMDSNENQLMLMLLIVTLMFMVYFLPFTIANALSRWGLPFGMCFTQRSFEIYLIIRTCCDLLKDLNFCTNFIIYCISGRRFRLALFSLIHRKRKPVFSSSNYLESTKLRSERLGRSNTQKIYHFAPKQTYEESQF
ncbi:unnamed protein product [Adineta steineri]|uniref:G-protein coupled receptors family 1 profile domain-containing protein n=1 Tax=Adineta steineri TaxID=433720 RepID=A0A815FZJ5_9BILA|nr:unnamed protein product [Adineta steineri]